MTLESRFQESARAAACGGDTWPRPKRPPLITPATHAAAAVCILVASFAVAKRAALSGRPYQC